MRSIDAVIAEDGGGHGFEEADAAICAVAAVELAFATGAQLYRV